MDRMLYPSIEQLLGGIIFAQDIHSMPGHFQDRTSTKTHAVFISNEFGLTLACLILNQHCQHTFPTATKNLWQTFRAPFHTPNGQTCSSCTPSQFQTAKLKIWFVVLPFAGWFYANPSNHGQCDSAGLGDFLVLKISQFFSIIATSWDFSFPIGLDYVGPQISKDGAHDWTNMATQQFISIAFVGCWLWILSVWPIHWIFFRPVTSYTCENNWVCKAELLLKKNASMEIRTVIWFSCNSWKMEGHATFFAPKCWPHWCRSPHENDFACMLVTLIKGPCEVPIPAVASSEPSWIINELTTAIRRLKGDQGAHEVALTADLLNAYPPWIFGCITTIVQRRVLHWEPPASWSKTLFSMLPKPVRAK